MRVLRFLPVVLGFVACRPELAEKSWDIEVLTPIAESKLTIAHVVGDTLLSADASGLLSLVRQQKVYEFNLDDMVEPFDATFENNVKLQTLDLGTRRISHSLSLGQISAQQGAVGNLIIINHGNVLPIPSIAGTAPIQYNVNANQFFQSMVLSDGWLVLEVENGFPIPISNFVYSLKNVSSAGNLISGTMPLIPAGGTVKDSVRLNNNTILEGNLLAKIDNLQSPGSNGQLVPVDTSVQLRVAVTVRDLKPIEARAIFPAQNLMDYTEEVVLNNGFELSAIVVDTGLLYMEAISTVEEAVQLDYGIPPATLNGTSLLIDAVLPPAPAGGTSSVFETRNIANHRVDLNGLNNNPAVTNTFWAHLVAGIDSTGIMRFISLNDSVYLKTGIQGLMPSKVEGWLGRDTFELRDEEVPLYLFEDLEAGQFDLEKARVGIEVRNPMGAEMAFKLSRVRTRNAATQSTATLNWSLLGQNLFMPAGSDVPTAFTAQMAVQQWMATEANSNVDALFEVKPDVLIYDLDLVVNPSGIENPNGFAYRHMPMEAWLSVEIPLHLSAQGLVLSDTSNFNYADLDPDGRLVSGVFSIIADNGMPLEAEIRLLAVSALGEVLDTMVFMQKIESALTDAQGRVVGPTRSKVDYELLPLNIERLKEATRLIFTGRYSTPDSGVKVEFYEQYATDLKLVGDFQYRVN